ncbi:MAG: thioredoxin family protein [Thermoanaerobaculia bacterium]
MKRIALLALLSLLIVPEMRATAFLNAVAAAQKQAKQKNQLIFVDLFAEWCGWCHRMEKEVFPSEPFQKATSDMVLLRLDTEDRKEGTQFAQKFGVNQLPTFMILTPDLTVAAIIKGYAPPQPFADRVGKAVKEHHAFLARAKNEAAIARDPRKRLDLAIEFENRFAYTDAEARLAKLASEPGIPAAIRDEAFYHLATVQVNQKKFNEGYATIRRFQTLKSKTEWVERTEFLVGRIYVEQGKYREALAELRKFKTTYPASPLSRHAEYMIPQLERALAGAQ